MTRAPLAVLALALMLGAAPARAHVGSPDTIFEGAAGPYTVRVVARTPGVIPGLAEVAVRVLDGAADEVLVQPVHWDAPPDGGAPPPDRARPVRGEAGLWSASLWLMTHGSYAVRVDVKGAAGQGTALVPVAAVATRTLKMAPAYGAMLLGLGLLLYAGAVSVVGSAVREAALPAGATPGPAQRVRGWIAAAASALLLAAAVWGGWLWWQADERDYRERLYRPFRVDSAVRTDGASRVLSLAIDDDDWRDSGAGPLTPDHGKLMHLFLIREPALDAFAHLHPAWQSRGGTFDVPLPPLPEGRYRLYADVTHENGFAQTLTSSVLVTSPASEPLRAASMVAPIADPDDSWSLAPPVAAAGSDVVALGDGYTLRFERREATLAAGTDETLRFRLQDGAGRDVVPEPYMGMLAHAVITREDGAVFIHLHPTGTISMASQMLFERRAGGAAAPVDPHAAHRRMARPTALAFPYQFPREGRYRMWVQVMAGGVVRTAAYDLSVH